MDLGMHRSDWNGFDVDRHHEASPGEAAIGGISTGGCMKQPGWVLRYDWTVAVALAMGFTLTRCAAAQEIDFVRDVRPLLSNHCFQCHGPDEQTREADLRLDTPDGLFGNAGGDEIVIPGDLAGSLLWQRVSASDPDERMPPPHANKALRPNQIATLRRWIEQGAKWEQHWAFIAPQKPPIPKGQDDAWCRTPIDRFVLRRLTQAGLAPAPDADPYTLVRRLYLDLIGLPPGVAEADYWANRLWDEAEKQIDPQGLELLVDRLLASPHYGEKWAQHWLDLARYADTNGYEKDRERSIWPYRDWVVRALNADMPFDRFTVEQLAGDLLPDASLDQRIATGFHRNTMLNEEGGIDPLEYRFYAMTDRVSTTATVWLGLTLGCAQCHAHKFDPISHTEYYQFMALMNNADEPQLELPDPQWQALWDRNRRRAAELLEKLPDRWPVEGSAESAEPSDATRGNGHAATGDLDEAASLAARRTALVQQAFQAWLVRERDGAAEWRTLWPTRARSSLPILTIQADGSVFASGDTAKRDDYFVDLAPVDFPIRAIRLEALPDQRLPARGPGSTYYEGTLGDFFLAEIEFNANDRPLAITEASHSFAANRFGQNPVSAQLTVDGDVQTGWSVHGRQGERHVAVYALQTPVPPGTPLSVHMIFGRHFASSLGRFRFSATDAPPRPLARAYSLEVERALLQPDETLTPQERRQLFEQFLLDAPELQEAAEEIRRLRRPPPATTTLVLAEWPPGHVRPTHRHHRGEYLQPAERVEPGVPQVLHGWKAEWPKNRLGLARWLISDENPLTARVVVNRAWAHFFGTGLVRTPEDFGLQGQSPSHPDLLDWLAVTWSQDDCWSFKQLHRRIVTSRVYWQTSRAATTSRQLDPENRWLSYMPRRRLDAEQIRDQIIASSGMLDRRIGGPPVRPPQPAGVTEVAFGSPRWQASEGGDRFRRSLYTFRKRTAPFAFYATFDAPSWETCTVRRVRSNSPLQGLTLLNDTMVVELARLAANRSVNGSLPNLVKSFQASTKLDEPRLREALHWAFRSVLVRPPQPEEIDALADFFRRAVEDFASHPAAVDRLGIDVGDQASAAEQSQQRFAPDGAQSSAAVRQAAWLATWRALWALDEAVMRP
ncbi:MAG: DUF1553 domain-containing protein [Planctomycetota bacterium]|nr:MAG: DUF1553 domain-containing protein [Planctomycetota bacterium]